MTLECEVFSSLCQFDCRTSVGQLHNTKLVSIEPQHPWAAGSLLPAAFLRQQGSFAAPLNASSVWWTICMWHALSRLHGVQCGMIDKKSVPRPQPSGNHVSHELWYFIMNDHFSKFWLKVSVPNPELIYKITNKIMPPRFASTAVWPRAHSHQWTRPKSPKHSLSIQQYPIPIVL